MRWQVAERQGKTKTHEGGKTKTHEGGKTKTNRGRISSQKKADDEYRRKHGMSKHETFYKHLQQFLSITIFISFQLL